MLRNSCIRASGVVGVALFALVGFACGAAPTDGTTSTTSALVDNSLTANSLTANSLTANSLTANSLTANSLTANSLTANSLTANALRDPLSRELLKYVVSCALDDGDSISIKIDGARYEFDGSLGLAPEWAHGACDQSCQRWVTACVLSRVDAKGVKREISIRGDNPALRPDWHEMHDYQVREASYFGNLFVPNRPRFLCLAPGQTEDERVCGDSLASCPMTVVGDCDDACDHGPFRSFTDCSDAGRSGHGHIYPETITVFLPR
jgi:hypothetical protein